MNTPTPYEPPVETRESPADGDNSTANPKLPESPQPRQFNFSVKRFLISVAVFAAVVAMSEFVGKYRFVPICWVGLPLALLTLIATKRDLPRMVNTGFWVGLAAFALWMDAPAELVALLIVVNTIGWSISNANIRRYGR